MRIPSTFSAPSASAARKADRLESTPPERPTTTLSSPTLRTSSRMKATRIFRSRAVLQGITARLALHAPRAAGHGLQHRNLALGIETRGAATDAQELVDR